MERERRRVLRRRKAQVGAGTGTIETDGDTQEWHVTCCEPLPRTPCLPPCTYAQHVAKRKARNTKYWCPSCRKSHARNVRQLPPIFSEAIHGPSFQLARPSRNHALPVAYIVHCCGIPDDQVRRAWASDHEGTHEGGLARREPRGLSLDDPTRRRRPVFRYVGVQVRTVGAGALSTVLAASTAYFCVCRSN